MRGQAGTGEEGGHPTLSRIPSLHVLFPALPCPTHLPSHPPTADATQPAHAPLPRRPLHPGSGEPGGVWTASGTGGLARRHHGRLACLHCRLPLPTTTITTQVMALITASLIHINVDPSTGRNVLSLVGSVVWCVCGWVGDKYGAL